MIKLLVIFLLLNNLIVAQDSIYTLQPVEITAIRTGLTNFQSYYLLDSSEIHKGEINLSFEESLTKIPGLIISDRNNPSLGDKISIRGIGSRSSFGIRGIKILVDNIPLTIPDGQSQTNNIDLFSAGRIEILKGPSSSQYGNAAGGVISIQSEIPSEIKINPSVIIGEDELRKYSLKMSGSSNTQSYLVSFNNLNYTGFREHSERNIYQLNTIYKNSLSEKLRLTAVINYFNSPYLLNPSSLNKASIDTNRNSVRDFVKQQGAGEKANQLQGGITINLLNDDFNFETTIYLLSRNLLNPIPGRIIDLKRTSGGIRSIVKAVFPVDKSEINISAGVDVEFQSDMRKEFENNGLINLNFEPDEIFDNLNYGNKLIDQKEYVLGIGPFLSAEFLLNNTLGFLASLRYDSYLFKVDDFYTVNSGKRRMNQLSPATGIFFKPNLYSKYFLNYSTSFQTPTTSELSNRPNQQGGFNPDLNPERIYQMEFGTEYFLREINAIFSAALYFMDFSDLLIPYQISGSEEIFFRNAGEARNQGIEVMIEINPFKNFRTSFSYTFMNFVYKKYMVEFNGVEYSLEKNKMPGIPKQIFAAQIYYESNFGIWSKIKFLFADEYFTNDFNGTLPGSQSPESNFLNESYFKIDLRFGYKFEFNLLQPELFFGINNLLNGKYNGSIVPNAVGERYFEPAPGRTWYLGMQCEIF